MLSYFKPLKILSFIIALSGALAIFLSSYNYNSMAKFILSYIFAILYMLVIFIIFNLIAAKKMRKIHQKLSTCHAEDFIKEFNTIYKQKSKLVQNLVYYNLSTGYYYLGDNELTKSFLDKINLSIYKQDKKVRRGLINSLLYENNVACYYINQKDISNAEIHIKAMKELLDNDKMNFYKDMYWHLYEEKKVCLQMLNGSYDGLETYYQNQLERNTKQLDKVITNYRLGEVYLHYGKTKEAAQAFEYAKNNGGDTFFAKEAEGHLKALGISD